MSAMSEVDIRDWQRAEKIVEALPVRAPDELSNLPSWDDYDFLLYLITKQLDGAAQVAALFKPPVQPVAEKQWPKYDGYKWSDADSEEFSPYNGM